MPSRHEDWIAQAERDLAHASLSLEQGHFEWACFAAHQAAEKGLKAVYQKLQGESRGHSLHSLLDILSRKLDVPGELRTKAKQLDKNYIPTRYPDALQEGAPFELYTREEAQRAINDAEAILRWCRSNLA